MTVSNGIKRRKPIYSERSCDCGVTFAPKTSRQKHCSPECRFRAIAEPFQNSTGCWEWPKGYFTKTGYGQFAVDANTPETAHRMAYKVFNGNISQGLLDVGFSEDEMDGIMGGNWFKFYDSSFGPET